MAKHKIIQHPTFKPGQTADSVLVIAKQSMRGRKGKPRYTKVIGRNEFAEIVKWYYRDATLVFAKQKRVGQYVIIRVEEPQDPEQPTREETKVQPGTEEHTKVMEGFNEFFEKES